MVGFGHRETHHVRIKRFSRKNTPYVFDFRFFSLRVEYSLHFTYSTLDSKHDNVIRNYRKFTCKHGLSVFALLRAHRRIILICVCLACCFVG